MSEPTSIRSDKAIRSGLNDSGGVMLRGTGAILKTGVTTPNMVTGATAATDQPYGVVADADIANGAFGDIQVKDKALCLSGAAVGQGVAVTVNGSGKFVAATSGNKIWGTAVTASTGADQLFEVELLSAGRAA